MTTIKITALSQMGTTIPGPTLVPVVDMSGTPTTKKATIANIANAILSQAGNGYAYAARANLANVAGSATTVIASSQPNITSVGTLTSLTVSGATNLGPIGNVTITGGTVGQVLTTNGSNVLSWTTVAGGGNSTPAGSNTQLQFNDGGVFGGDAGLTFNKTSNDLTVAGNVITEAIQSPGNTNVSITPGTPGPAFIFTTGGALQIPGGHVLESNGDGEFEIKSDSGVVISSDISNTNQHFTFGIDGVFHAPGNVALEGTRLSIGPNAANVVLSSPTVVVNANSNVYVQAALTNENANGSADWVAYGTDGDDTGGWTDFGFTGYNFNDANYTVTGPGDGYLFAHAYANGTGGGNLVLATGDHGTHNDIIFATNGFATGNIFGRISDANNALELTRANSAIKFADGTIQTTAYTGGVGSELVNGDNSFVLDNAGNVVFEGDGVGQAVDRGLVWDYGANANGVNSMVRQDNNGLTVRAWTEDSGNFAATVNIVTNQDANTNTWTFDGNGNLTLPGNLIVPTGNIVSDTISPPVSSAITGITTGNATVFVTLAGYVFGDPVQGEVIISGVTGTTEANGTWGYEATDPNEFQLYTDATLTTPVDGTTWTTYISGGTAIGIGAYTDFTIQGGNVTIGSNDNTWEFSTAGVIAAGGNLKLAPDSTNASSYLDIFISSGPDLHLVASEGANLVLGKDDGANVMTSWDGNVYVQSWNTGTDTQGGVWTLGEDGNLTLPQGGIIHETGIPFGVLEGNTIALKPSGGTNADQQLLVYPTAGQDFNHLHLTSGNLYNTELFLGDDDFYVKLANTGNIVLNTNDSAGNTAMWTFGVDGNLTLPQLTTINDESVIGTTLTVGSPPTVIVISGADFSAVNLTYTKTSAATPTWEPAGYNPATDPYIEFSGGEYGIFAPSFGQALYVNTGTLNVPLAQWNINPPLGSVAPTAVYTYGASGPDWVFGADGLLTLPGGNVTIGSVLGGEAILASNTPFGVVSQGNGSTVLQWIDDISNATALSAIYINSPSGNTGDVAVLTGEPGANANIWTFGANGTLTLPASSGQIGRSGYTNGIDLYNDNGGSGYVRMNYADESVVWADPAGAHVQTTGGTWDFGTDGALTLPEGGAITNNIPPVTFTILYQYDDLEWSGNTLTFTNASSGYMLAVLALMEVGDAIVLAGTPTTVTGVYTGGGAGTFTVSGTGVGQQIAQFTLPNRLTSVNGIKLTTNSQNYLFTEAGVTQSPVLTVDTLPSGQFAVAGFRAFVSDANLAPVGNFGAIVGNSGSNTVCVWCDGTNWRIG